MENAGHAMEVEKRVMRSRTLPYAKQYDGSALLVRADGRSGRVLSG